MIFGFPVYRCHGNIDFLKLSTTTNFSLSTKGEFTLRLLIVTLHK